MEDRGTFELSNLVEDLEIHLVEDDSVVENLSKSTLIGKIIADRLVSKRGVIGVLRSMWSEEAVTDIRELAANTYSLCFNSDVQRRRALEEGP
ncbi:hypothetical protein COLO4_12010 [Corchorus olitorius]|uniref:Uncharacterized protein n=1 Tax=Corchorus olitorius TaxID=93759 RepID=A0A1R3K2I8_9ROSI|nr:hypothetical protein COLO4_12010 [Corchorus olitorius]